MKKLLLSLVLLIAFAFTINAQQTVKQDKDGNYVAISKQVKQDSAKPTNHVYIDKKGNKYPVYISVNGKPYVLKTSAKTGNVYKYYLKVSTEFLIRNNNISTDD